MNMAMFYIIQKNWALLLWCLPLHNDLIYGVVAIHASGGTVVMSSFESMSPTLAKEHWSLHGGEPAADCSTGPAFGPKLCHRTRLECPNRNCTVVLCRFLCGMEFCCERNSFVFLYYLFIL